MSAMNEIPMCKTLCLGAAGLLTWIVVVLGESSTAPAQSYPFQNTSLAWDTRVDDLVSRLTLDEVIGQLTNGGTSPTPAIGRLGVGPYQFDTECLRGDVRAGNATSFPQALGLAASFDPSLLYRVAEATAEEVRGRHNDAVRQGDFSKHTGASCFSPVINVMRHPLWGRNQETYGEDPYLAGVLAGSFVRGLQGNHSRYVRATSGCKHFAAYSGPEDIPSSRLTFDAKVSMEDLRMTFLPAFRMCVEAGTYNFMCTYTSLNGVPTCADTWLLTEVLREEWGFRGYVISDQGAVGNVHKGHNYVNSSLEAAAVCVKAGCNLELSGQSGPGRVYSNLGVAVERGMVTEDYLRGLVKPLFYTRMRLGEFDPLALNPYSTLTLSSQVESEGHRQLALEAALKSFVLLKNDDAFLPLKASPFHTVAVVGPMANDSVQLMGDYSADTDPRFVVTPLVGLQSLADDVTYAAGCSDTPCTDYNKTDVIKAVADADVIIVCLGTGQRVEAEAHDRGNTSLPGSQLQLLQDAVSHGRGGNVLLLLFNAGPVDIRWAVDSPDVAAILECFFPAQATGEALRQVLLNEGDNSVPAGRLPYTWPQSLSQVPPMTDYSMKGRTYRYSKSEPLFPFGYGLSYSSFQYSQLMLPPSIQAGQNLSLSATVTNMGQMVADEAVQVYLWWEDVSRSGTPLRQLVGVSRVTLQPSSPTAVHFLVQPHQMALWTDQGWVVSPGRMGVSVGGQQPGQKKTAPSNVLTAIFQIQGTAHLGNF